MKKISIFLLLTTTVISLSPAEKQRPRQKKVEIQRPEVRPLQVLPLFNDHMFTLFTSPAQIPSYAIAQNPTWQPIEDIVYIPHNETHQTYPPSEVELQPIYKHTNTSTNQDEKKSLLRTNSLRPNPKLMQELFDAARYFIIEEKKLERWGDYKNEYGQKSQREQLILLIERMNNARNDNINEDLMGQFAYNNKKGYEFDSINIDSLFPLFFILLKKYTLTVNQTGEQLPLQCKKPNLENMLSPEPDINKPSISIDPSYLYDLDTYPAFFKLIFTVRHELPQIPCEPINLFIDYMYGNKNIPLHSYSQGSYKELKNDFYTKAYDFLLWNKNFEDLYNLVQMIDVAKNKKDITHEDDLVYGILGYELIQPGKAQFFSLFDAAHDVENVKKRIALLCRLIQQYNNNRLTKITPTITQLGAYMVQDNLKIPVPNKSFFDEKQYAFAAFAQLTQGTDLLQKASEKKVHKLFEIHYPQKK
jgi:hypothetical protein